MKQIRKLSRVKYGENIVVSCWRYYFCQKIIQKYHEKIRERYLKLERMEWDFED